MLTGRQIAWMIYEHFRLTDIDGAVLEFTDLLRVELRGDNLRAFDTSWDETLLAMAHMPEDHYLESLYFKQLEKCDQIQNALQLYIQDHVQRGEPKSYTKLRKMVRNHLDQKTRERHIQQRERRGERGLVANPKNKAKAKPKSRPGTPTPKTGDCHQWVRKGSCSRGDDCNFKHDDDKKGPQSRTRSPSPSGKTSRKRSPTRDGSPESKPGSRLGPRRGTSPSGKDNVPPCSLHKKGKCTKGDKCNFWHSPVCRHFKRGNCTEGDKCVFVHPKGRNDNDKANVTTAEKPTPKAKAKAENKKAEKPSQ